MAADAPPTSYKDAPSLIEWDSLPEEDQFKQQEEMTKFLQQPSTIEQFLEECKKIGQTAAAIEGDFRTVLNGFLNIAATYGKFFPDVANVYVPRWEFLMSCWNSPTGILSTSKKLAIETADALIDYGEVLALIVDIQTRSQLQGAQSALRDYVAKHPIGIGTHITDMFKILRFGLLDFADKFAKYVASFGPSADAISFEASIKSMKQCQETIAGLNEKIQESAMALGCSSVFGILSDIPVGSIGHYVAQRNETQANLVKTKSGIIIDSTGPYAIAFSIYALRRMQAEFEMLKPDIDGICDDLSSFAYIWAFATEQCIEINVALNEGMIVLSLKKFRFKLALLIAQIEPLREGLRVYAAQI